MHQRSPDTLLHQLSRSCVFPSGLLSDRFVNYPDVRA